MENAYYWLMLGAVLLAFEAFVVPGVGFLFAGLAGFATGVLVKLGAAGQDNIYAECAWFFGLTICFAALLWKRLKSSRLALKGGSYNNMVGTSAVVYGAALVPGKAGQVKWSDAVMNAELYGQEPLPEGEQVEVIDVRGNTLMVKKKL